MNNTKKCLIAVLILLLAMNLFATKYAGEIFRMGAGVRNFALGNIGLSDTNTAGAAYWNAALLNEISQNRFELMHAEEYAGLLKYDTAAAVWGRENKISVVITRIGIDDIPLTKLEDPNNAISSSNRPYKYKSVNNSDIVVYAGIARKFGKYIIGISPKMAYRNLAEESGFGFGADLSTYFKYSKGLIGIKLHDFFTTQILWANGTHEIVNPGLDVEANYNLQIPVIKRLATIYAGGDIYTEGRETAATIALGPLSLDFHFGCDLELSKTVNLLLGYDVNNITSGLAVQIRSWQINYAFENDTELENSHRVSVGYLF
ncbi:MAG: hypothetical protein K9N09_09265 [Candidatus Cloacimonetes bacterium]|nr:hypothetical protein [Candidatus Cloacimonadota bacterium]MCF7814294.1 hypothetical protein [Candidatus Cloacimonadota bacterium]MCF7868877.1 hypothetical protein [Candidatus Cloacimonadota bacterium]MCF7884335.1 hypothetical protein [Candidatus Cloacimonadota bacterium]